MNKIKVSELFYSIQGEGRFMGVPSIFLRVFGCNFSCRGFGMPKGELSIETLKVDEKKYNEYTSLPLVNTGCDSYASWDPRFKHLSPVIDTHTISNNIVNLLPNKDWGHVHLVITGGEPLLGFQRSYPELLSYDIMKPCTNITFETNGTQFLHDDFANWLHREWHHSKGYNSVTFSVSPKLSNSGEKFEEAIKPDVIMQYEEYGYTYLKFVVATEDDAQEADEMVDLYRKHGFNGPVYLMPVGGVESVYSLNNRRVAELALKRGYRYSDRLQVLLFKNAWNT